MLVDSHCHLDLLDRAALPAILDRARAAGVGEMVSIATSLAGSAALKALVRDLPGVWCTVGVHPHRAGDEGLPAPDAIALLADDPKVVGIGETGLDYHHDKAPRDAQRASFRNHLRAARLAGMPVAIHTRDADDDTLAILREERSDGDFDFLLHCFSSGPALAAAAVAMGGYVSFSGMATFPRSAAIRDVARDVPLDRLLVETDAPYLAPVPFRGRPNEPAYVAHTASALAGLRGMDPGAMAERTTANFRRLFRRAVPCA